MSKRRQDLVGGILTNLVLSRLDDKLQLLVDVGLLGLGFLVHDR